MRQFNYKCIVSKNGSKMYYKKVGGKWKRISNKLGKNLEKGKNKYQMTNKEREDKIFVNEIKPKDFADKILIANLLKEGKKDPNYKRLINDLKNIKKMSVDAYRNAMRYLYFLVNKTDLNFDIKERLISEIIKDIKKKF